MSEKRCLACKSDKLVDVLDLGTPYLNDYVKPGEETKCAKFPLHLIFCNECKLGQLKEQLPQDSSFRHYWYRSGITQTMTQHLKELVETASKMVDLHSYDDVLDIGCNDGTLLRCYPSKVSRWGFEPARNLASMAREGGNNVIEDYFTADNFLGPAFKIITAVSMFYDVPDPLKFLQDVYKLLRRDGVFIVQMNYAGSMFEQNAFDNIGHEHVGYYTLHSLWSLLMTARLEPFKVEMNDINGGSFRVYARKDMENILPIPGMRCDGSVSEILLQERHKGLTCADTWQTLAERIEATKRKVTQQVWQWNAGGYKVWLLGASTRSSTFMQYFGLDHKCIAGASERDERKYCLLTSGTLIPIYSEEIARQKADCFIVGPWAFKKELIEREHEFLNHGGEMLFPMPNPTVVTKDGEYEL